MASEASPAAWAAAFEASMQQNGGASTGAASQVTGRAVFCCQDWHLGGI